MKIKIIALGSVLLVMAALLLGIYYKNSGSNAQQSNPMKEYESLSALQKSLGFDFKIPNIVRDSMDKSGSKLFNYSNMLAEVVTDDLTFRAAEFIAYDADISGDYNKYEVDNQFINSDESLWVRYRSNETDATIVSLKMNNIAYSIKFNTLIDEENTFKLLGITEEVFETMEVFELDKQTGINTGTVKGSIKSDGRDEQSETGKQSEANDNKDVDIPEDEKNKKDNEVLYVEYVSDKLGISLLIPKTSEEIVEVYTEDVEKASSTFMIHGNVAFNITRYYDWIVDENTGNKNSIQLDKNSELNYIVDNPFDRNTEQYNDFDILIKNIDKVAKSFELVNDEG